MTKVRDTFENKDAILKLFLVNTYCKLDNNN